MLSLFKQACKLNNKAKKYCYLTKLPLGNKPCGIMYEKNLGEQRCHLGDSEMWHYWILDWKPCTLPHCLLDHHLCPRLLCTLQITYRCTVMWFQWHCHELIPLRVHENWLHLSWVLSFHFSHTLLSHAKECLAHKVNRYMYMYMPTTCMLYHMYVAALWSSQPTQSVQIFHSLPPLVCLFSSDIVH